MSARAAESDRQVTLALADVVRQQVDKQIRNAVDELTRLRERPDVSRHSRMPPCQLLEFRNVVGIRQETDVEDQIAIRRQSVPVPEAGEVNENFGSVALPPKLLADEIAQI